MPFLALLHSCTFPFLKLSHLYSMGTLTLILSMSTSCPTGFCSIPGSLPWTFFLGLHLKETNSSEETQKCVSVLDLAPRYHRMHIIKYIEEICHSETLKPVYFCFLFFSLCFFCFFLFHKQTKIGRRVFVTLLEPKEQIILVIKQMSSSYQAGIWTGGGSAAWLRGQRSNLCSALPLS